MQTSSASNSDEDTFCIDEAEVFYSNEDWRNVQKAYTYLVSINLYNGKFWSRLGGAYYNLKDYRASIESYKRQTETGFQLGKAMYNIARNYSLLNQPKEAVSWLQKVLSLKDGIRAPYDTIVNDSNFDNIRNHIEFVKLMPPKLSADISRVDGWRTDLEYLAYRLALDHYNLYNVVSKEKLDAEIKKLHNSIPELPDHQIIVEMMKIVALVGDGHTSLFLPSTGKYVFHRIPVIFYEFKEGLYIRAASYKYRKAVGMRVIQIGSMRVEEAREQIKKVIHSDNEFNYSARAPTYLSITEILYNLSMTKSCECIPVLVKNDEGRQFTFTFNAEPLKKGFRYHSRVAEEGWVTARDEADSSTTLWLKDPYNFYWFEYLEDDKVVYFQFNRILNKKQVPLTIKHLVYPSTDDSTESIAEFSRRMFDFIEANPVESLVIDIRLNHGGNNSLNHILVHEIIKSEKINQIGRLYTIIGRETFSAAQCLATDLETETKTIFVGEPTGSKPNFIGNFNGVVLPYSGLNGSISHAYHQHSLHYSSDYRNWIAPDLVAELSIKDFKSNVDPAMKVILEYLNKKRRKTST